MSQLNEFSVNGKHIYTAYSPSNASVSPAIPSSPLFTTALDATGYNVSGLSETWANTRTTVVRTKAVNSLSNPQILAVQKAVLVVNNDTTPTASIGIEADNSGGIGTYFGMNLYNDNDTDFGITSTFPYQGSVIFDQEGVGSVTTKTAIKQGTITSSDTANTNATTISPTSIAMVGNEISGSYTGNAFSISVDATPSNVGSAGISGTTINSAGTLLSSLGGGVAGIPSPPYPAPDANWSISVQTGSFNPTLYMSKSAPFTNSTSITMDVNGLTHNQGTGSVSPDTDFTISTNKDLLMTADNIDLSPDRLIMPSLASANYMDYNTGNLTIVNNGIGGLTDPQLLLTNSNATLNTFPTIEMNKTGRNLTVGESVGSILMYGLDAGAQKTEFARIQVKAENVAVGNEDGTLSIFNAVNGVSSEVFNFNGGQNENNTFRPMDMNGNALRSNTGNLVFETLSSVGVGAMEMKMKAGGFVNIPSSADASNDYIRINPQVSPNAQQLLMTANNGAGIANSINLLNAQYNPIVELKADFGGAINKTITLDANGNTNFNKLTAYDGQSNNPFQIDTSGYTNGSIEMIVNDSSGDLIFTGTNIQSGSSGGNSGQHLRIKLNGTYYKIPLQDDV